MIVIFLGNDRVWKIKKLYQFYTKQAITWWGLFSAVLGNQSCVQFCMGIAKNQPELDLFY